MQTIINEWQLGTVLNQALQQQQRADFALWLALLSPAVNEMAEFATPKATEDKVTQNLHQQLAINPARSFAWQVQDNHNLLQLNHASQHGLAQLKLQSALTPEPWVAKDDAKKLDAALLASLDSHCLRRLRPQADNASVTDETALYDILQKLNTDKQVA